MKKWLCALCPKYSKQVLAWFEVEAISIYGCVDEIEKIIGREIDGSVEWVDGVEL